ncbi:MAG: hypothetical protein JWN46_1847 [Acidimicrobiales bacterium]|nr:hypothetical protein [Acidimicrobiales bacterium]
MERVAPLLPSPPRPFAVLDVRQAEEALAEAHGQLDDLRAALADALSAADLAELTATQAGAHGDLAAATDRLARLISDMERTADAEIRELLEGAADRAGARIATAHALVARRSAEAAELAAAADPVPTTAPVGSPGPGMVPELAELIDVTDRAARPPLFDLPADREPAPDPARRLVVPSLRLVEHDLADGDRPTTVVPTTVVPAVDRAGGAWSSPATLPEAGRTADLPPMPTDGSERTGVLPVMSATSLAELPPPPAAEPILDADRFWDESTGRPAMVQRFPLLALVEVLAVLVVLAVVLAYVG